MKIVIEYIGVTKEESKQLLKGLSDAAAELSERLSEIGMPDSITIER